MTRSPLARRLSQYKNEGLHNRDFGLVSVLSPFNKEGVYEIPKPGDFVGSNSIPYHMLSPFNKEGMYVFQTRISRSFTLNPLPIPNPWESHAL
ncbi:hypothetical protein Hanom_Chr12g01079881 [Helianthus anomalus]